MVERRRIPVVIAPERHRCRASSAWARPEIGGKPRSTAWRPPSCIICASPTGKRSLPESGGWAPRSRSCGEASPTRSGTTYPAPGEQGPEDLAADVIPLNRLPEENDHPGKADVDQDLSLQHYLTFIQRALATIDGVPPVYGAKILATASDMQRLTGWDPAAMFLRSGSGDHRHLIRAVMAMVENGLINKTSLGLPAMTTRVFERYGRSKGRAPWSGGSRCVTLGFASEVTRLAARRCWSW